MEQSSFRYNKDRNHDDRYPSEDTNQLSSMASQPTNRYCIPLTDTASNQPYNGPCDLGTWPSPDVTGTVRSKSLERSTNGRADGGGASLPRWDGVSVWVPNTDAATSAARRRGERRPVQRSDTLPAQSLGFSMPATTTTGSARRSRGSELLSVASSTLSRVWNRRPTKFLRNFATSRKTPASEETWTFPQRDHEDQPSTTLVVCRKCRGRTVNNSLSVGAANVLSTATTRTVATAPEVSLSPVSRDLETESGYLVGRAASNSPNDAISCRTLPSTSPDDVSGRERDQKSYTKRVEPTEAPDDGDSSRQSSDCAVVKDALPPEELLSWKLSLMDRADGRELTRQTSWVRGGSSSSDDDEDDDCAAKTLAQDAGIPPRSKSRAESTVREFIFENVLERTFDEWESLTPTTAEGDGDGYNAAAEDVNDLEKLFDDKLDELLRTSCDATTDRLPTHPFLSVPRSSPKDDDETQLKQRSASSCDGRPGRQDSTRRVDDVKSSDRVPADRLPQTSSSTSVTDLANDNADSSVVASRRASSLPPSTPAPTSIRAAALAVNEAVDVGGSAVPRLFSRSPASVRHVDDEAEDRCHDAHAGSVCCRLRSKSLLAVGPGNREPPDTERRYIGQRQHELFIPTDSVSTSCSRHRDVTLSTADVDGDDNGRVLTWRQLRTAIADAVVELVDDLRTAVDGREASRIDVGRLQRRLLRSVRTALWTGVEPADARDNDDDELRILRTFFSALMDCSEEDDAGEITGIKKYIMTCPQLQAADADDAVNWRQECGQQIDGDETEVNVFVLRHGVKIDGVHVSVAGRNRLPVDTAQDSRIQSAFAAARGTLKSRPRRSEDEAAGAQSKVAYITQTDDLLPPPPEWNDIKTDNN